MPSTGSGIRLGISFARWRAEELGLDYRDAFTLLCGWGFDLVRLSTSWLEVDQFGYEHLDWLISEAGRLGQKLVLTVGMKALGWPEFYLPRSYPYGQWEAREALLLQVAATIRRYRECGHLLAWQIENEPFNRSGPQARTVDRSLVRAEAGLARRLDPGRPVMITAFAHFDAGLDRNSSRFQGNWRRRLGLILPPEREALAVLRRDDILGLDVYRSIGWQTEGRSWVARAAPDQLESVGRWKRVAERQRKRLWITEAQAEPWEATRATHGDPRSVQPEDIVDLYQRLSSLGPEVILLWGAEYWLWRERNADARWSSAVRRILEAR
jgi:hypothetical protein